MKKILLLITFIALSVGLFGQAQFYKGITVGKGGNVVTIDSIIKSTTFIKFYEGATELLAIDTTTMLGHYIERKDTSNMLSHYIERKDTTGMLSTYITAAEVAASYASITDSMKYPASGIALSTGTAWSSSITNNSTNWNTAYTDRLKWDGGSTGLTAATGRTSLGGTTVGQALFTMTNPSAIRFVRINADNTVSALSAADQKTALGATTVGDALFTLSNPSAITFPRINADNSVTALSAADFRIATATIGTADSLLMLAPYILDSETQANINDSIAARLAAAIPAIAIEDTINGGGDDLIPGIGYLRSYVPSSTSIARRRLVFTVDVTTGAPTSSDSTLDHSYLIGKDFDVYRSGVLQGENFTATNTDEGFRFNNTLGRVTVNPLWQANEDIIIDCFDPVVGITYLALEGEESDLETDLLAYFTMDDNGDQLVDQLGYCNINKYNTPTNQQEGKINYAWLYDGEPGNDNHRKLDTTYFNHADAFSVSMWIKSSATNSDGSIVGKADGGPPVNGWTVEVHSTNVTAEMWDGGVEKAVTSSTDCSDQTWHHIVMTYDGTITLYIDGASEGTPIAASYGYGTYSYFGISRTLAAYWDGYIDNILFWHKGLSAAEVLELYTAENAGVGYPW